MPIGLFRNMATEDIHYGRRTKAARRLLPEELHMPAQTKLARLSAAESLQDLRSLPGNRFEALKGNRREQYSIRINHQYRICFLWFNEHAEEVKIVDYH
jgi:toxin HigB-1